MRIEEQDWPGRGLHDNVHYTALLQEYRQAKWAWELRKKHIEQGDLLTSFQDDCYVHLCVQAPLGVKVVWTLFNKLPLQLVA